MRSPALCVAPSDFSSIVVRPPRMLPGDGCVPRMSRPSAIASASTRLTTRSSCAAAPAVRRARGEQVLGAHDLGNLSEHHGAAELDEAVGDTADRRVRCEARTCSRSRRISPRQSAARRRTAIARPSASSARQFARDRDAPFGRADGSALALDRDDVRRLVRRGALRRRGAAPRPARSRARRR